MTILITGATGSVGRLVVDNLLGQRRDVRALTRDPGTAGLPESVDVVAADLGDPATFTPELFSGVDAVFLFPTDVPLDPFVDAAVAAGVGRFVVLSSLAVSAEFPRDIGSASNVHHTAVEKAVTSRTAGWTMLRPGTFANNLLSWAYPIATTGRVTAPYIDSAQTPVHEADVAEIAALALTTPGHDGKVYEITGPESLTRVEQVAAISAAIDREIDLEEITPEQFREDVARFIAPDVIDMLLDYWSDTVATPDVPKLTYAALTGKPGRTLAQWAREHKEAFGG